MYTDLCGNCKFFNEHKRMVNGSYLCDFQKYTVNPLNYGCYKIQFSSNRKLIKD